MRTKSSLSRYQVHRWVLAALLLAALGATRVILFQKPEQADPYLQQVREAAKKVPTHFGTWLSVDADVPPAAITMLRPNLTVSRQYVNNATGQHATLLLIQCADARSLRGHYPPVCYVSSGYKLNSAVQRDWHEEGLTIQGMEYAFSSARPDDPSSMIIYDFMMLPDGRTCRNMDGVDEIARDPRMRQFGAAQLQVLLDPSMPEVQRDDVFHALIQANRVTIDAILAGEKK